MLRFCTAALLAASVLGIAGGCSSGGTETKATTSADAKASTAGASTTTPKVAAKDLTHTITADAKYSTTVSCPKTAGTLPKGTAVLLMTPGATAQVMTPDGKTIFVDNAVLKPK
jgi:hypothetical protein